MVQKAVVTSFEAIEQFRASLVLYLSKARPTLEEASAELVRTRGWLETEQRVHWENQVRLRTRKLDEAQQAFFSSRISFLQRESSAEFLALQKAKRALEEAQQKLRTVKQWNREFDNRVQPLAKQMEKLHSVLSHDLVLGLASLAEILKTLDAYARIPTPGPPPGDPPPQEG
jgi:hypothetical protein